MQNHELKTDPDVFQAAWLGVKDWEIRRGDRKFRVGHGIISRETQYTGKAMRASTTTGLSIPGKPLVYTGREMMGRILFILPPSDYGLRDEWCILSVNWMAYRYRNPEEIESFWRDSPSGENPSIYSTGG